MRWPNAPYMCLLHTLTHARSWLVKYFKAWRATAHEMAKRTAELSEAVDDFYFSSFAGRALAGVCDCACVCWGGEEGEGLATV